MVKYSLNQKFRQLALEARLHRLYKLIEKMESIYVEIFSSYWFSRKYEAENLILKNSAIE